MKSQIGNVKEKGMGTGLRPGNVGLKSQIENAGQEERRERVEWGGRD